MFYDEKELEKVKEKKHSLHKSKCYDLQQEKMRLQRLLHPLNLNVFKTAVDLTCIEIGLLNCIQ